MAQRTQVTMVDDHDGTESDDVKTRHFGMDGIQYEVDLSDANWDELCRTVAAYVASARKLTNHGKPIYRTVLTASPRTVRRWAIDNGHNVPARGRIPTEVNEAFAAAQR